MDTNDSGFSIFTMSIPFNTPFGVEESTSRGAANLTPMWVQELNMYDHRMVLPGAASQNLREQDGYGMAAQDETEPTQRLEEDGSDPLFLSGLISYQPLGALATDFPDYRTMKYEYRESHITGEYPHPHGIGFDHIMHLQLAGENDPVTPSHTPISVSTTHADIALPYSPLSGFPESPSFVVSPTDTPPFQYNDTSTERYESAPNLLDKSNTFRMDVSTPAILRASELRRTVAARYVCKHCHKTFTTKQNLKYHHNVHFGRKEFVCSVCKKAFTTPTDVKRHGKKLHRFQFVRVEPNERSSASFTYCALSCGL